MSIHILDEKEDGVQATEIKNVHTAFLGEFCITGEEGMYDSNEGIFSHLLSFSRETGGKNPKRRISATEIIFTHFRDIFPEQVLALATEATEDADPEIRYLGYEYLFSGSILPYDQYIPRLAMYLMIEEGVPKNLGKLMGYFFAREDTRMIPTMRIKYILLEKVRNAPERDDAYLILMSLIYVHDLPLLEKVLDMISQHEIRGWDPQLPTIFSALLVNFRDAPSATQEIKAAFFDKLRFLLGRNSMRDIFLRNTFSLIIPHLSLTEKGQFLDILDEYPENLSTKMQEEIHTLLASLIEEKTQNSTLKII